MNDIHFKELRISGNTDMTMQIIIATMAAIILCVVTWLIFKDYLTCYLVTACFTGLIELFTSQSRGYHDQPSLMWRIARKLFKTLVVGSIAVLMYYTAIVIGIIMYHSIANGMPESVSIMLYYSVITTMCITLLVMFIFASVYIIHAWRFWWDPLLPDTESTLNKSQKN